MEQPIRVVLADDHAVVRKGIREFLEEAGGIVVVAEASEGDAALDAIRAQRPDVAVLDIQMPRRTGIEVTRAVRAEHLPVGVLVLTAYDDDPYVQAVLEAGANGYVLKNASSAEIVQAVHTVREGQMALDPAIARKIVSRWMTAGQAPPHSAEPRPSPRELDVLKLVVRGQTNKAIAAQLGISERTVQGHLASLFSKLGVNSRTEAVVHAAQLGWVSLDKQMTYDA
jgi:DNA-binding NarL/FixJ family response regulator